MAMEKALLLQKIEEVLAMMREGFYAHGGNIEVVDVDTATGRVMVRLEGACVGCPMSDMTLKAGIEDALVQMYPDDVREVVRVDENGVVIPSAPVSDEPTVYSEA